MILGGSSVRVGTMIATTVATACVTASAVALEAPVPVVLLLSTVGASLFATLARVYWSAEGLLSVRGVFAVFFILTFVARPLQILRDGDSQWIHSRDAIEALLPFGLVLVQIGIMSYWLGYSGRWSLARRLPAPTGLQRSSISIVRLVGVAAIGACALLVLIGEPGLWISNLFYRRELLEGRFYLYLLAQTLPFACLAMAGTAFQQGRLAFPIVMVSAAASVLAILGGRAVVVFAIFSGAVLYDRHVRRVPVIVLCGLVVFLGFFLATFLQFRVSARGERSVEQVNWIAEQGLPDAALRAGFTGVDRFIVLINGVPSEVPFQYGKTYLRVLAAPVPRQFWPGKPGLSEATVYADLFGAQKGIYPGSFIGDMYLNGHVIGVVLGMFVMGLVHRSLDQWRELHSDNASVTVIYAIAAATVGGGLGNVGIVNALLLTLAFLAVVMSSRRWRRSVADTPRISAGPLLGSSSGSGLC